MPNSHDVDVLYRQHAREMWAIFYSRCCDAHRAYDAVQEAFLRYTQYKGEPIRNLRAWLLQVGKNWLLDQKRKQKKDEPTADINESLSMFEDDPAALVEHTELQDTIREALKSLKLEDRQVLVLRYALGWSSARIAEALETSTSAVDMRISRARVRLAALLETLGIGHETV